MSYRSALVASLLFAIACSSDADPTDELPLAPPAEGEGFQMSMTGLTAPAGSEVWLCSVYRLPTDNWEFVNRVESVQNPGMHHMDIMATAFAQVEVEPGVYQCDELYEEYPELMEDGLIIYAAQDGEQEIQLPEGIVANLPPALLMMQEIHYVNTTEEDVELFSYVNAYTIHPSDVKDTIWGGAVRDTNLNIPANATEHTEWTRCVMTEDVDILFMSSHMHQLGESFVVRSFDGESTGDVIYTNDDWHSPFIQQFETPMHVPAGQGFEFACNFSNPNPDPVTWGFTADDEMCQIALVYTPGEAFRKCEPVDSSDGVF